ncbi:hypothetical protein GALMADRAFT_137487 [Galerina marginata CBS 339.88]|uniref:Uncharacterized protein n=1 Tax=Galerina marginata (strain CBS 339.88) TaxID=685588 RepID=A0A067TIG0_GALM3|nr:hypothetical protein GALMADRAFT_137487 [Galerina marginata CBS 339.88]
MSLATWLPPTAVITLVAFLVRVMWALRPKKEPELDTQYPPIVYPPRPQTDAIPLEETCTPPRPPENTYTPTGHPSQENLSPPAHANQPVYLPLYQPPSGPPKASPPGRINNKKTPQPVSPEPTVPSPPQPSLNPSQPGSEPLATVPDPLPRSAGQPEPPPLVAAVNDDQKLPPDNLDGSG